MTNDKLHIAFIGFGEAAGAFCSTLDRDTVRRITAFDIATDGSSSEAMWSRYRQHDVSGGSTLAEALAGANVVFSVVTAAAAHDVAVQAASCLEPGALFLDCNSCAPQTKLSSANAVDTAGGRYVDVAVMAPVQPALNRTPLLLCGEHAESGRAILDQLNMNASIESGPVGKSSSVKMVRSIMVKGMEALFAECLLAGRLAGVDEQVLKSLEASHPGIEWKKRAGYNLERMSRHGIRRSGEMEEVCTFLRHLGIKEPLSASTVSWQRNLGELGLDVDESDYAATAETLIKTLKLTPIEEA